MPLNVTSDDLRPLLKSDVKSTTSRTLGKALAWGTGFGLITAALLEPLSFGIAHGSGFWPFFLVPLLAMAGHWPGSESKMWLGIYQFLYCVLIALAIAAVIEIFRIRAERLAKEAKRDDASDAADSRPRT